MDFLHAKPSLSAIHSGFCALVQVDSTAFPIMSPIIEKAIAYMEKHFREPLSVAQMAKMFYLSPAYWGRQFKKETKMSFSVYLTGLRIQEAKRLLRNTPMRNYEIATTVGFSSYKPVSYTHLEARLRDMLEMSEKYHLRFQRQMRLLREQMLRLLLCGEYSEALSATLTQMDISFDGRFVGAAVVLFPEEMPQHSSQQALIAQIEDLSTEDIAFYACPGSRDNSIDLVLSLEECEGNAALGAMAMLEDLLRAEGILALSLIHI